MSAQTIDYDALAKQHGATVGAVDYDALAAHHGAVDASPPAPSEVPSLWQRAKDNFNAGTQGAKPGDGAVKSFIENVGAGGGDLVRALAHPIDTISNTLNSPDPALLGLGSLAGSDAHTQQQIQNLPHTGVARTIGQLGAGAIVGGAAGRISATAAPALADAAGKAVLLGKTPEGAYEGAMKPSPAISAADRTAMVRTGLDNAIPVSRAGLQKLGDLIEDLNQKINDQIASDPNRPIDPNKVATRADAAKARFASQVNAGGDLKAIEASRQQFLEEQGASTPAIGPQGPAPMMGAADAQAMKQGTYRVLKGKFGEQGSASVEAQKSLARGLKEEIANQFPEIGKLNAAESQLLDLQPVLERAVNRISNHQAFGIGTPVAGVAAETLTGSVGVGRVAMVLKGVLDNPAVKSRLAIAVSKSSKIPIGQAISKVNTYAASLGAGVAASQASSSGGSQDQPATQQSSQ